MYVTLLRGGGQGVVKGVKSTRWREELEEKVRNHKGDAKTKKMRKCSSMAENIYIHTTGIFPEGTLSHKGSTLQEIFPRGLSLMEATCTGAGKNHEEEGMAKIKYFGLIATPPFLTLHCLLLTGRKVMEHTTFK